MYGRTRRYYRSQRKREEIGEYLRTALWILTLICIIVVCVTIALQARASQVIAAESTTLHATAFIGGNNMVDIVQTVISEQKPVATEVVDSADEKEERMIVIDPGHGGMDGGCVFDDVMEKDINREIALAVVEKLKSKGYQAMLARKGDDFVNKMDRVTEANRQNALLYISIHQNSYEMSSISGIETWYYADDKTGESRRLAQLIQQEAVKATGAVGRELVADTELCVLNKSNMPACLIETGFLSNKAEREKLCTEEYRDQVADGIVKGIDRYLDSGDV